MSHAYSDANEDIAKSYKRIHANDEQTLAYILSAGDEWYISVAVDIDPVDGSEGEAETIAYSPTLEAAHKRTERWLETNSRGVGASSDSDSGGVRAKVWDAIKSLDVNQEDNTDV